MLIATFQIVKMDALRHEREDLWFVSRADFITAVKEFKSGKWPIVLTSSSAKSTTTRVKAFLGIPVTWIISTKLL